MMWEVIVLDGDETERGMLLSAMFRMEIAMMFIGADATATVRLT
jgi:hypothetical protein